VIQGSSETDCLFCKIPKRPLTALYWHDRPLMRIPGIGAAVAGLGAFVPGYVLVFPEMHVVSTLDIPERHFDIFQSFVKKVLDEVERAFGPTTVFEHSSCTLANTRRSACIDHAHIHLMPGSYSLDLAELDTMNFAQDDSPLTPEHSRTGYLLLAEPGGVTHYFRDPGVSQYFRRKIAARLGSPDEWDYLLFPHLHNVELTTRTIGRQVA